MIAAIMQWIWPEDTDWVYIEKKLFVQNELNQIWEQFQMHL